MCLKSSKWTVQSNESSRFIEMTVDGFLKLSSAFKPPSFRGHTLKFFLVVHFHPKKLSRFDPSSSYLSKDHSVLARPQLLIFRPSNSYMSPNVTVHLDGLFKTTRWMTHFFRAKLRIFNSPCGRKFYLFNVNHPT